MAGCWVVTVLKITGYRPLICLNRENAGKTRALLKSGRISPFVVLQSTSCQAWVQPNVISTAPGCPSQFRDTHCVLLFMTLSTDMLIATWAQALACWLWSWSCITYKRTARHSSVNTPRNISRCVRLPGHTRVRFHPTTQKTGLVLSVLKYTFSYLLSECQF